MQILTHLKERFELPGVVTFDEGKGGLLRCNIKTGPATAEVYLHGATLTKYQRTNEAPLIFCSETSPYRADKAIRGGVPICFPWFGPNSENPELPQHGFARNSDWTVSRTGANTDGSVTVAFSLNSSETTRALWNHEFEALYTITVGNELTLALTVTNIGGTIFQYEEALHTYFQVSDVRKIKIAGLERTGYLDKTQGGVRKETGESPLQLTGETDSVFLNTEAACILTDGDSREIRISKSGSSCTVVWNPWEKKAEAMADLSGGQWSRFVCVEAVNAGEFSISLLPGETHSTATVIE